MHARASAHDARYYRPPLATPPPLPRRKKVEPPIGSFDLANRPAPVVFPFRMLIIQRGLLRELLLQLPLLQQLRYR